MYNIYIIYICMYIYIIYTDIYIYIYCIYVMDIYLYRYINVKLITTNSWRMLNANSITLCVLWDFHTIFGWIQFIINLENRKYIILFKNYSNVDVKIL